jgi:hypothetical protein
VTDHDLSTRKLWLDTLPLGKSASNLFYCILQTNSLVQVIILDLIHHSLFFKAYNGKYKCINWLNQNKKKKEYSISLQNLDLMLI